MFSERCEALAIDVGVLFIPVMIFSSTMLIGDVNRREMIMMMT